MRHVQRGNTTMDEELLNINEKDVETTSDDVAPPNNKKSAQFQILMDQMPICKITLKNLWLCDVENHVDQQ